MAMMFIFGYAKYLSTTVIDAEIKIPY